MCSPKTPNLVLDDVSKDGCPFGVVTPDGVLQSLGDVGIAENPLAVRNLHIGGDAQVHWGRSKLRRRSWMATTSKFMERFGQRVRTRDVVQTSSGSPVRLSLSILHGANTPEAARILVKRQLPLRTAHVVLTEMVDHGKAFVTVPCVEDLGALKNELSSVGVVAKVHAPQPINVREVRDRTKLSQEAFSVRYGLDLATLRNWEQGRSEPDAAANTLLWTIARNPDAVEDSLDMEDEVTAPSLQESRMRNARRLQPHMNPR
jgi:DNA-binding transcriptional regulator YiaG